MLYKQVFKQDVPNLDGQIAWGNLKNFQREFVRIRAETGLPDQEVANPTIRQISFGKHRIDLGFTELTAIWDPDENMGL